MKKNKFDLRAKLLIFSLFFAALFAANPQTALAGGPAGGKFSAKDMIMHHVMDEYEWHIATTGDGNHITIPLPVILWTDQGLDVFSSSEFHHNTDEEGYITRPSGAYKVSHGHLVEKSGKSFMDFSLTKNAFSIMLATLLLMVIFLSVAGAYKKRPGQAPKGLQAVIEPIFEFIRDDVVIPNIGEKKYRTYLPFIMALFFFIWFNNLLGLIPTGANASGNIAFTLTLAVFTLIITNISGNKHYWGHIFWTPGVPLPLRIIMLPVEVLGIFTKPFALMIRLFANITAGHIIILSLISFIFIFKNAALGLPVGAVVIAMTFLELFVAALQAYIFALLSALFIGLAVEEHDDHH
ncbi:MAG: F0F1 ATP synthase subunit A [Flammeovirgaceae bacterium]